MMSELRDLARGDDMVVAIRNGPGDDAEQWIPGKVTVRGRRWITVHAGNLDYRFGMDDGESDQGYGYRPRLFTPEQAAAEQEKTRALRVLRHWGLITGHYLYGDPDPRKPSPEQLSQVAGILDGSLLPHGPEECCCKHCPWDGNHREPGGQKPRPCHYCNMLVSQDRAGQLHATNPAVAEPWACPASPDSRHLWPAS
jgi:hypothetical protein